MSPTRNLHHLGQSIRLDSITRGLLESGTLQRYIDEMSVTGLTSNPTIFGHAIGSSITYRAQAQARQFSQRSDPALAQTAKARVMRRGCDRGLWLEIFDRPGSRKAEPSIVISS